MVGCTAIALHCSEASESSSHLWLASPASCRSLRSSFLDVSGVSTSFAPASEEAASTGTSSPSRSRCIARSIKPWPDHELRNSKATAGGWTSFLRRGPSPQEIYTMQKTLHAIDNQISHTKAILKDMRRRRVKNDGIHTVDQYTDKLRHLQLQRRAVADGLKTPTEEESGEMQFEKVMAFPSGTAGSTKVPGSPNTWGALAYETSLRADEYEKLAREAADSAGYYDYVAKVAASHAQAAQLQVELSARGSLEHNPTIRRILEHCRLTKALVEEDPSKAKERAYLETRQFCSGVEDALDDATRVPERTELPDLGYATYEQPTRDYPIPPPPASDSQAVASGKRPVKEQGFSEHAKEKLDFEGALDKCIIS
mmetsp:Transcript_68574/g.125265  ORF Transcript_68574/g.125265 Transcript_68574/m.125265 type:complete len:369 (+) Transcript_68574:122-1228(+)